MKPAVPLRQRVFLYLLSLVFVCANMPSQPAEAVDRIQHLRSEIKRHDELYYKKAAPEISDEAYDALKRELRELEAANPGFASPAPSAQRIDDDASDPFFQHIAHRVPMLSLDNTYDESEVRAFDQRVRKQLGESAAGLHYTIEPKIDGAGVSLVYERGRLTRVLTRGNGLSGDDIIANTRDIRELPQQLADDGNGLPDYIEVRGEIYMTFADFKRVNALREAEGLSLFANPRNLAAGSMKLHEPAEVASRALRVFVYGMGACESGAMRRPVSSQRDMLARFRAWGLPVIEKYWSAGTSAELVAAIAELGALRVKLAYPIDGAVIKADDFALKQKLGAHATAPRWAIAFKYTARNAETRVRAITLQIGRTGVLTPVAELEPVMLSGAKITRATLHNPQELVRRGVRVGDVVVVEKAGDVIPEIVAVKTAERAANGDVMIAPFEFPNNCPECATPLVAAHEKAGAVLETPNRCPNMRCPAQVKRRITYFASKACVDISGLGEATVDKLVSAGFVRDAAGLYELTPQQIATLDGFAEKSAARLHAAINASRRAELWRVIAGLGIPEIATARAKTLGENFATLEELFAADEAELAKIPGIGRNAAASIKAFVANPENRRLVERLAKNGVGLQRR